MDDGRGRDAAIRIKLRLLKTGLYGFMASLVLIVSFAFLMGAVSLLGLLWKDARIIGAVGEIIGSIVQLFFAAPFAFFAVLMVGLLKTPREVDMRPFLKPSVSAMVIMLAGGIALSALPILAAFSAVMATLYFRGAGIIFLAMAYFGMACLVFFVSGCYTLIREAAAVRELETDIGWVRRVFRVLRVGSAGAGPEMDEKTHRTLSRIERAVGSAMGVVLFLLFKMQDIYEAVRSITGHGSDSTWLDAFATMETVLALFSMFIFIFSTLFIIRSVKTVFMVRKAGLSGTSMR